MEKSGGVVAFEKTVDEMRTNLLLRGEIADQVGVVELLLDLGPAKNQTLNEDHDMFLVNLTQVMQIYVRACCFISFLQHGCKFIIEIFAIGCLNWIAVTNLFIAQFNHLFIHELFDIGLKVMVILYSQNDNNAILNGRN